MGFVSTGSYLPPFVADNHLLATFIDTDDAWITQRTGIEQRHVALSEGVADVGAKAAQAAIDAAGIDPNDIGLIILASCTADSTAPSTASYIQGKLGIENAIAFDLVAACSGFVYGLSTAYAMIQAGLVKKALIIGAEVFSKVMDYDDRASAILFGDGGGAVIIDEDHLGSFKDFYLNARLDEKLSIVVDNWQPIQTFPPVREKLNPSFLRLDGKEVYKFAVVALEDAIQTVLKRNHLTADDIAYIVPHQANLRIVQSVAKSMKMDTSKFYMNIGKVGNTSAASIPIALDEMNQAGLLKKGDKIILAGFGAGLTWGSVLMEI